MKQKIRLPLVLLLWFTAAAGWVQAQQCNPDVTPPVALCNDLVYISLAENGISEIGAWAFDNGSYDACCLDGLKLRRQTDGPCDTDSAPDTFANTLKVCCADIGNNFTLIMRAYDCAGNTSDCMIPIKVEDKIPPLCQAPADLTVSCENFDPTLVAYGPVNVIEACCIDTVIHAVNYSQFDTVCHKGTITRTFRAYDCSGNSSLCSQKIVVQYEQDYFIRFPDDITTHVMDGNYGEPTFFRTECEVMGMTWQDAIFTNVPEADVRIERTWTTLSWCGFDPLQDFATVPNPQPVNPVSDPANFPGPVVSAFGTQGAWAPTIVDLTPQGPLTNFSAFHNNAANGYIYKQIILVDLLDPATITGTVFADTLDNCLFDSGEQTLEGWVVRIEGLVTGTVYETLTDAQGIYSQNIDAQDTLVEVSLSAAYNYGQNCPSSYTISATSGQESVQDIPVKLETDCPILSIDLSAPFLRRCFSGTYTVAACNVSDLQVADAYTEVTLDSYLDFEDSSIPGTPLGNNTWRFDIGDLGPGACSSFTITVGVGCDAPLGYTHCSEAHIFPDTVCNTSNDWTGADLEVSGICTGDSVILTVRNIGSGPMTESQDFVVVEDVVMYTMQPFQLGIGESTSFGMEANGATWRMQAEEVPNHPWGGVEAKAVEGCGGLNETGLVTMFSFNTPDPFETTDCQENIGAYDPNDKMAFPKGYGTEHFIEANTDIEYRIRFQNTGTDTAFTVVVLDTLSQHLDATAVRPGASSHKYDFAILDGNVLRFRFDNILLPDSSVNQAASNGYLTFSIPQKKDNAIGTLIENDAAIYFDFNEPVITNTTFHTIGKHFVVTSTDNQPDAASVKVFPNPSAESVFFELPEVGLNQRFTLSNSEGKTVKILNFNGKMLRLEKGMLTPGVYFYRIDAKNGTSYSGKVILK